MCSQWEGWRRGHGSKFSCSCLFSSEAVQSQECDCRHISGVGPALGVLALWASGPSLRAAVILVWLPCLHVRCAETTLQPEVPRAGPWPP